MTEEGREAAASAAGTAGRVPSGGVTRRSLAGESVSNLGFGCMRLPRDGSGRIDEKATGRLWARFIEAGGSYFDTAYMYHEGESETAIGRILAKRPRSSWFLADKMPLWMAGSEEGMERIFRDQLEKTRAGHFDFYLLHALGRANWDLAKRFHALEFLQRKKREGLVRHVGFSFHDVPEVLAEIVPAFDWEFAMIQLNYLDWTRYRSGEQYRILEGRGLDVAVMEPLRGSALARLNDEAVAILKRAGPDRSAASWGFRWVASLPSVKVVNSGMSCEADLEDNLSTFSPLRPLDGAERRVLDDALAAYLKDDAVPCTACRYCVPCPAGVDIPAVFNRYNIYRAGSDEARFVRHYEGIEPEARASRCVRCGRCAKHCPQKIAIPDELAKIDSEYARIKKSNGS